MKVKGKPQLQLHIINLLFPIIDTNEKVVFICTLHCFYLSGKPSKSIIGSLPVGLWLKD